MPITSGNWWWMKKDGARSLARVRAFCVSFSTLTLLLGKRTGIRPVRNLCHLSQRFSFRIGAGRPAGDLLIQVHLEKWPFKGR